MPRPSPSSRRYSQKVLVGKGYDAETYAQFQALLDAPPSENPKLRQLTVTKAPWDA